MDPAVAVEMLIEGKREVKNPPPPVKLAPVKPPSREHPEPEQDVQWDEFLTGALLFSLAAICAMLGRLGSAGLGWAAICAMLGRLGSGLANRVACVHRP